MVGGVYMQYLKYKNARDASWEILIELQITELPVKISRVIRALNIPLYRYSENQDLMDNSDLGKIAITADAFTILMDDALAIFYDDKKPPNRVRFTLAHELGHIICGHLSAAASITAKNKEPDDQDDDKETQANIFASRLLSPAYVLKQVNATTVEQIMAHCRISQKCATFRLERLQVLEQRHEVFLSTKGHSCYGQHPLERQMVKQFAPYIKKHL